MPTHHQGRLHIPFFWREIVNQGHIFTIAIETAILSQCTQNKQSASIINTYLSFDYPITKQIKVKNKQTKQNDLLTSLDRNLLAHISILNGTTFGSFMTCPLSFPFLRQLFPLSLHKQYTLIPDLRSSYTVCQQLAIK